MTDQKISDFIKNRAKRWWKDKEPHPLKNLGGKQEGRKFASDLSIKVPKLHAKFPTINSLPDLKELPEKFVLKPIRGWSSKNVFLISDGMEISQNQPVTRETIIKTVGDTETVPFIAEEMLIDEDHRPGAPRDYKFYCFGDRIAFIHVVERNSLSDLTVNRHWFLTEDWKQLGIKIQASQTSEPDVPPRPACYDELIKSVKDLGAAVAMFMRIDMYATTRGAIFGEFTPQPHGGNGYTKEADLWLGSFWVGTEGFE